MKLHAFKPVRKGKSTRYVATVSDVTGAESHQIIIAGPTKMIREVFKESDFDLKITPGGTREDWELDLKQSLQSQYEESSEAFGLERIEDFFKQDPSYPTSDDSIFISLRKIHESGTRYSLAVPLFVPMGVPLFFLLPPVCNCAGILIPAIGDPDLRLAINGIGPPFVASSLLPGTAWDRVSFSSACLPFTHFVPFFRVDASTESACNFIWGGYDGLP